MLNFILFAVFSSVLDFEIIMAFAGIHQLVFKDHFPVIGLCMPQQLNLKPLLLTGVIEHINIFCLHYYII